jgi:ATP-binding cassette subfamily B protein
MLLCSPVLIVFIEFLRRKLKELYLEIRDAIAMVNSHLAEQIDGVSVLQLSSAEQQSIDAFDKHNSRFRDACSLSNIYDSLMFAIIDGIGSIFIALLLWYGCGLMAETGLPIPEIEPRSAGIMIAFIDYLNRLLGPIRDLSSKIAVIQRALAALVKIFGLVDAQEPYSREGEPIKSINGKLEIKDLRFRYTTNGPEILKGISFSMEKGQVVAVVGSSGSGKTTLGRILDRSYSGYSGSVLLDGIELSSLAIDDLSKVIATVRQDIHIFSDTVQFNVNLGNPDISMENMAHAIKITHADQMIERLGWEYELQERGTDISVGEGQLLTFARTMAHQPEIIILDEATASVDTITESLIQQAIGQILSEKTVIVIAHRLSTIQKADKILVMEQGVIVEQGTHNQLMNLQGRYSSLFVAGQFTVSENSA